MFFGVMAASKSSWTVKKTWASSSQGREQRVDFKDWLAERPYAALLSEGTIKLMKQAWEASRELAGSVDQHYEDALVINKVPEGSRMLWRH
jgi:hypothetical protein